MVSTEDQMNKNSNSFSDEGIAISEAANSESRAPVSVKKEAESFSSISMAKYLLAASIGITATVMAITSPRPSYNAINTLMMDEAPTIVIATPTIVAAEAFGPALPPPQVINANIKRGQTLMELLVANGVPRGQAHSAIEATGKLTNLRRLQIGQQVEIVRETPLGNAQDARLQELALRTGFDNMVRARRTQTGSYNAIREEIETQTSTSYYSGTIDDSLFLSASRAGVPDEIIVELIRAFSFEVDFQREIWPGDGFEVYFDQRVLGEFNEAALRTDTGAQIDHGDIQYASLTLKGKTKAYYRHTPSDEGRSDYFGPNGQSARRALMKTPVDGARLSGRFGPRKHPVLGYNRMHQGLDFAAPTGTPIMAAGDGVVERSSRYGSFGNYIRIRHNSTYKTIYAHLSRYGRGIKAGARVKQGQIIGYVGATGRVTGAHLHYEVYKDGKQTNPLTLRLPTGRALTGAELEAFNARRDAIDTAIRNSQYTREAMLMESQMGPPVMNAENQAEQVGRLTQGAQHGGE